MIIGEWERGGKKVPEGFNSVVGAPVFVVQVHSGKVPEDRVVLRALAEEMRNWPNLEVRLRCVRNTSEMCQRYVKEIT